jgi:hypothetical protein
VQNGARLGRNARRSARRGLTPAALLVAAVACCGAAVGQPTQDSARPGAPAFTLFADHAVGFEIEIPADWMYDRTVFPGPEGSLGVLQGRAPSGRATLQILVFREPATRTFPRWIDDLALKLGRLSDTQRVKVVGNEHAARPEAIVAVDAEVPRGRTHTLYYCVQFDDGLYWAFSYAALLGARPERDRAAVRAAFERLIGTLRVTYDPRAAQQQEAARQRGVEFARALPRRLADATIDAAEQHFEIRLADRPVGYLVRRAQREQRATIEAGARPKPGLRVREQSWRFGDDGSALFTSIDLFSSEDLRSDLYEITHSRVPPLPTVGGGPALLPETTVDQCIREGNQLVCSFRSSLDVALPDPRRPLALDESYLGLAWVRVLPMLVGSSPGAPLAFVTYDVASRAAVTQVIEPLGPRPLPEGGEAFAYLARDGFSSRSTLLYADASGRMLRLESGDLVLRRSDPRTIDEAFRARRQSALQRLSEHGQAVR